MHSRSRTLLERIFILCFSIFVLAFSSSSSAQDLAALTGVVTDTSGAVIPDVSVKLIDTKTNATYETRTNAVGAYTFLKVFPGTGYRLLFSKEGFATQNIENIYVGVDATHTQNAQLRIGSMTESVEVNGSGSQVSLNTTDSSVATSLDMLMVHELPMAIRDTPLGLLNYSPGYTFQTGGSDNTLGSRDGSVAGARGDQSNYTLDGLDTNDFGTGQAGAMTANAPVDSIQEMRIEVANPLSAEGRGSGAMVQLSTKSGTNKWHGAAYEYNWTAATEANDFFNNRQSPVIPKPALTRNQFGASLGGPIKKDKLFFFFNYEGRRDATSDPVDVVVPLDSFRAGNVAYINNGPGCSASSRINTQPQCISTFSASNTSLDPAGIGPDQALLSFINSRYKPANDLTNGDGINTAGFRWNSPSHYGSNDYVTRIDYNLNGKMKLFGRVSIVRRTQGDDANFASSSLFPGDPVTHQIIDHSYAYVFGHTWTISNTKVNQFTFGETRGIFGFPTTFNPPGTTQYGTFMPSPSGIGQLSVPFYGGASQHRSVPIPVFRDDFNYVRGSHAIQIGATFKPIKDSSTLVADFNTMTIGLGNPVLSVPGPADLLSDPIAGADWSYAYAFALGRIASVNSNYENSHSLQPLPQGSGHTRNYRYYETEAYLQDTWRVKRDLTMTYGLRWQYYSVPYELNGFQTVPNIDFASMYNLRAAAGQAGISGDNAAPPVVYNFGGKANHAAAYYHPDWRDFAPRLSFAYNPSFTDGFLGHVLGDRKTVVRAGAGVVYDHTILSAINFFNDQSSFVFGQTVPTVFQNGLASDPRFTALGALPPLNPPQPATVPITPYLNPPGSIFPYGGLIGNANEMAIDPHYKTPYSETITLGFQRELPGNFLLESTYFLRMGHRLLSRADAGQVVDFKDPASGQSLVQQFTNLSIQARTGQPISDSPFFDNLMTPVIQANYFGLDCPGLGAAVGLPVAHCADLINQFFNPLPLRGDMADTIEALYAGIGLGPMLPSNVGLDPQFSSQLYFGNKSYSNYNGLLTTLHKKMSHGLQFDFNYTYSHSIDNSSTVANNATGTFQTGGYGGFLCDAIRLRSCRSNSDFDVTHLVSAAGLYDLPFGRGKWIAGGASGWVNHLIGGWQLAFLNTWHSGFAFTTVTEAFPVSFNENSPAVFVGQRSDIKTQVHNDPITGQIQLFANPTAALNAFTGPFGLDGPTRNNLRGPRFSNTNLSLNKHFVVGERYGFELRAEAYNVFNQVNFALPTNSVADINAPNFGAITSDAGPRVMQFSLRLDF
jgi:hypothetical protein